MKAYFSNRIYKNELENSVLDIVEKLKMDYSYVRNYSFQFIRKEQMGKISFENTDTEPFNSLYYRVEERFKDVPIYLRNSAIQDAKAVYKSQKELNKLYVDNLVEKINKVNNKIDKTLSSKLKLQEIKNQLKQNNIPISNKGRKHKLLDDGKVVVTYGVGKNKKQVIYDNIYIFETQYLKT